MKHDARFWLAAVLAVLCASPVWADRPYHHYVHPSVRFGIYVGDPWLFPYPYPYWPRVYVPPVVVTPAPPPVYLEQVPAPGAATALEPGFWYYCAEAKAYYPYVKQCLGPWQKVAPQPPQ